MTRSATEMKCVEVEAPKATMPTEGAPTSLVETMMRKDMEKDNHPSLEFGR